MPFSDLAPALAAASSLLVAYPMLGYQASDLLTTISWTWDPCKPTLSIPHQILTMNSLWNTCSAPVTAFFDPPYTLSAGNGLFVPGAVTSAAAPGPTLEPATASVTVTSLSTPTTFKLRHKNYPWEI